MLLSGSPGTPSRRKVKPVLSTFQVSGSFGDFLTSDTYSIQLRFCSEAFSTSRHPKQLLEAFIYLYHLISEQVSVSTRHAVEVTTPLCW